MNDEILNEEYKNAIRFATTHYENFPVISFLVPKNLRKHIAVIYKFARQADDIADEGNFSEDDRLAKLNLYESEFNFALKGKFSLPFWKALTATINDMKLSPVHFTNLIKAFKQDLTKKRYKDFQEVLDYCKYSANPVGRLILELFNIRNDKLFGYSDSICTALQLTNFLQDLSIDYQKGRIYIPEDELAAYYITEKEFVLREGNSKFIALIKFQVQRILNLFTDGYSLIHYLPKRLKYEIGCTILGGEKILEKIVEFDYNVLNIRPVLTKFDYMKIFISSLKRF
ncbi:MAG: squalene synthase HpnC [Ignavibacteriales bacterium]|nr:squalene synthase HpnC [Ignavibacteriales bacterium]